MIMSDGFLSEVCTEAYRGFDVITIEDSCGWRIGDKLGARQVGKFNPK